MKESNAKLPRYSKLDESSETSRNSTESYEFYGSDKQEGSPFILHTDEPSKSKPDLTAKSNAQGEETKLILYLGGFRTRSGVAMIINTILLLVGFGIITVLKVKGESVLWYVKGAAILFLPATVLPFLVSIINWVSMICGIHKKTDQGKWILALMIHSGLWSFILMIASIWLIVKLSVETGNCSWDRSNCIAVYISGVFGLLASVGLGVEAVLHMMELKRIKRSIKFDYRS